MRPAFLVTFAGFAMASSLWAARANASACAVDTDCLDNGIACGTDVCTKAGTCVPAGSDPGTCSSPGNCKCYGLASVLCNPENHSCTMTSLDGGLNSGGATSGGGGASSGSSSGGMGASGTMGAGGSGTTSDVDAGMSQAASGSTVVTSGTVIGGPGTGSSDNSGASVGGPTVGGSGNGATGNTGGSGASAGSTESSAKASKSGCTVGFGNDPVPGGMLGIMVGAWVLSGRRRGRNRRLAA